MRLLKVRFRDFRRLHGTCSLDVDEALIALVGPNEAGKSSVLDGIEMLLTRRGPADRDVARESGGAAEVSGLFLLESDDREAISAIHGGDRVERAWMSLKSDSATTTWNLEPHPTRDLAPRARCRVLLRALDNDPALDPQFSANPELPWDPVLLDQTIEQLGSDTETLEDSVISSFDDLANRIRDLSYPPAEESEDDESNPTDTEIDVDQERRDAREAAASALVDLAQHERQPDPWDQITDVLQNRLPMVAFFQARDRELQTAYVLSEAVPNVRQR